MISISDNKAWKLMVNEKFDFYYAKAVCWIYCILAKITRPIERYRFFIAADEQDGWTVMKLTSPLDRQSQYCCHDDFQSNRRTSIFCVQHEKGRGRRWRIFNDVIDTRLGLLQFVILHECRVRPSPPYVFFMSRSPSERSFGEII